MKRLILAITLLALMAGAFIAGSWLTYQKSTSSGGRKVLYYVDPMNPAHKSDRPGIAPCGMPMEPVYADEAGSGLPMDARNVPGMVRLSTERQQSIGMRLGAAERKAVQQTLRLLGRVAVDETRYFQVTAPSEGWVTKAMPLTVGHPVKRDQTLALFYSPTFISAGQAFRNALEYQDRMKANPEERAVQRPGLAEFNVKQYRESLRNLGVSDRQIDDMIRTRRYSEFIEIVAPADGFITARNVTQGQRFEKGFELYRIVDLSHVWILVDVFDIEESQLRPGTGVQVSAPKRGISLKARVSEGLPQFDPASRALKVRLEANNPGLRLRPDMFVDIELPVYLSAPLTVPSDAVIDTGLRKTVYIDRGNGYFEPRRVETGGRFGDRVEITKGLMEGERIVISGNFLIDSESRIKLAASGLPEDYVVDPVCGMGVDPRRATLRSEYHGQTFHFCSAMCKEKFDKNPGQYLGAGIQGSGFRDQETGSAMGRTAETIDVVCGMQVDPNATGVLKAEYQDHTYYFCAQTCRDSFLREPARYVSRRGEKEPKKKASTLGPPTPGRRPGSRNRQIEISNLQAAICNHPRPPTPGP